MWTLAAVFGKTSVDTGLLSLADMIKVSGKSTMTLFENGNEEDAWWVGNKFCTPMEYYAQSSADYDGHAGKLGNKHGVFVADSNSKLIMSGTVGLDTNRVRVLDFLCRTLRPDKKFLWDGGIQYHHYSNTVSESMTPTRFQGRVHGITPEEDSLRQRLAKVRAFTYKLQPGVECILGEYGFDKNQQSPQSAPIIPGYSAAQSQGIMLLRSINAVAFSGFDKLVLYWMKDMEPETNPYIYLTSGLVHQSLDGKVTPYPSWFYVTAFMHHLGDYVPFNIIKEDKDVYAYVYKHATQPDSLAMVVYAPSRSGKKYKGYTINYAGMNGPARIVVDVDEVPKIILFSSK
jgi:hypothetical protein